MLIDFILCNFPFLRLSFVLFVCLLVLCIRMFEGAAASFFTSAHPFSFPTLVLLHFLHSPLSTPYTRSLTLPSPTLFAHSLLLSFSLFLLTLFAHSLCSLSLLTLFGSFAITGTPRTSRLRRQRALPQPRWRAVKQARRVRSSNNERH